MRTTLPAWLPEAKLLPASAKIVATLGPASDSVDTLERLIREGVSIFRLNFSHGDLDGQALRLANVRQAIARVGRPAAVLGDLQGPKMRVRVVPDLHEGGGIVVETGSDVLFRAGQDTAAIEDGVPVFGSSFDRLFHDVEPGQRVLVNDGAIRMLAVDRRDGEWLRCRVTFGGRVTTKKGVNLPDTDLRMPAITERDWGCVEWAVKNGLDFLALSFVRTAEEVWELKEKLVGMCSINREHADADVGLQIPVISKIEKPQALTNLEQIIEASDGVMVARGDLGVEMDAAQVPVAQKYIVARCEHWGRPCIVATQMLESMIEAQTPSRAEASDVANAVFDGADAVMLSGETAVGKHPVLVVETMRKIIEVAEARMHQLERPARRPMGLQELPYRSAALATGAWHIAREARAACVAVWSQAGGMARYLSQNDFDIPIVACTSSEVAARRMCLFGGVVPVVMRAPPSRLLADWTDSVETLLLERGLAKEGDAVVLVAGKPLGSVVSQDTVAILRVGDPNSGFRPR